MIKSEFPWNRPKPPVTSESLTWCDLDESLMRVLADNRRERDFAALTRWLRQDRTVRTERYYPFDSPALFRIFVTTEATEAGFARFAAEYGGLRPAWPSGFDPDALTLGSFSDWLEHHEALSKAVGAYDRVVGAAGSWEKEVDWRSEAGRVLNDVSADVNRHFYLHQVKTSFFYGPSGFRFGFWPSSLIGVMWIQLWEQLSKGHGFKVCEGCREWFKVSDVRDATARRSDARLCGDPSCKMRAIRNRAAQRKSQPRRTRRQKK
ncbi:MAG: hypothetical protein AB1635_15795 [Acidobacteriota bacterium]